jgi:DNA mismatch repair ATPase MutS
MVNLIMAQTMGLCASSSAIITPFTFINTQINVPDSTGYESLFEAEMHRCKYNLDSLEKLDQKGFSLIIMDEIFNSTNPVEAISGAFAVCKRMSNYKTNMLIFTTHFNYLTKLAKEPTCSFANYRMETIVDDEDIKFTYKLEKGVNKHLLALELLRKSGFESNIITDAIKIKNKLTSRRRK